MFLEDLKPLMDTRTGSVSSFRFIARTSEKLFWIYFEDQNSLKQLEIRAYVANEFDEPDFDEIPYCEEIRELVIADKIDKIIICTIDGFSYWYRNEQEALLCANLCEDAKAIVAITKRGKGILQIANNEGVFVDSPKILA